MSAARAYVRVLSKQFEFYQLCCGVSGFFVHSFLGFLIFFRIVQS